jgi:NADH-quinone oxidoreductase subunit N
MGLASGQPEGAAAALIYLALYLPATIGIFALIMAMRRGDQAVETIDDLAGSARNRPLMAGLFTALLFSIAGVPPLAGFFGKYVVFRAAVEGNLAPLAVLGGVAAVVAAAYYLRVVSALWFKPAQPALQTASGPVLLTATAATALTFPVLVVALGWIEAWANAAVHGGF